MFKIGDFSKLGQVSTRMLRHYDQMGLLRPGHIDKFTGYRYYTIEQLSRLHRIIALKELGFSLEQIAHLLGDKQEISAERLWGMLVLRQAELARELQEKQMQLSQVEARLQQIEQEGQPSPYEIVVKSVPAQAVASIRQVVPRLEEMGFYCRQLYEQLYGLLKGAGIMPSGPEITIYHHEEYQEVDLDVETAVSIPSTSLSVTPSAELTLRQLPAADLVATLIYEGPFDQMTPAILALLGFVGRHNHVVAGPLRELHLSGPAHPQGAVVETAVIELQLPIQKVQ